MPLGEVELVLVQFDASLQFAASLPFAEDVDAPDQV